MALALHRSRGYRQLCSLWFEYDLCLNRKPPNDLESFFNDSDSNMIKVGSQMGLSYDSNTIKKPPSELGLEPIKRVTTAMFSLVRIRPMFEQEAPK